VSHSILPVAVIAPEAPPHALQLPPNSPAQIVLRPELSLAGIDELVTAGVKVVVLDLRTTCSSRIGAMMRLLRLSVNDVRLVTVAAPGDNAAAQACIAGGAVAHLGSSQDALSLLRAVNAAQRRAPFMGETGQRAVRVLSREHSERERAFQEYVDSAMLDGNPKRQPLN